MINESNFIVRLSGKKEGLYYIDYLGTYKITEISKVAGMEASAVREKYLENGAAYDQEVDVYYFNSIDSAKKTIESILKNMKSDKKGKVVVLTEAEIEYIRKALINEGANSLHVRNKIKDAIFNKLNA